MSCLKWFLTFAFYHRTNSSHNQAERISNNAKMLLSNFESFIVLPKFSVSITGPKYILPNAKVIGFSVQARYVGILCFIFCYPRSGPMAWCVKLTAHVVVDL